MLFCFGVFLAGVVACLALGRSLIWALLLGLADLVLPTVWQGYDARTQLVWRVGATCLLAFVCCAALSRHGTCPSAKQETAFKAPQRTEVERAAMALADSVCPKKS